jgi:hypothetical protein
MLFGLYSIGFAVMISEATYVAHLSHVLTHWIVICAVALLGAAVVSCCPAGEPPEFPGEDCHR